MLQNVTNINAVCCYIYLKNLPKLFVITDIKTNFLTTISGYIHSLYTNCVVRVAQSVQRLATGWTVQGSNPGGGEIFRTCPDRPWDPPSLLYNGYQVFPGGRERPGRDADPSPPSSAMVMKEQSYTSTPPIGRTACTEPQCLYKAALYLFTFCSLVSCASLELPRG